MQRQQEAVDWPLVGAAPTSSCSALPVVSSTYRASVSLFLKTKPTHSHFHKFCKKASPWRLSRLNVKIYSIRCQSCILKNQVLTPRIEEIVVLKANSHLVLLFTWNIYKEFVYEGFRHVCLTMFLPLIQPLRMKSVLALCVEGRAILNNYHGKGSQCMSIEQNPLFDHAAVWWTKFSPSLKRRIWIDTWDCNKNIIMCLLVLWA